MRNQYITSIKKGYGALNRVLAINNQTVIIILFHTIIVLFCLQKELENKKELHQYLEEDVDSSSGSEDGDPPRALTRIMRV